MSSEGNSSVKRRKILPQDSAESSSDTDDETEKLPSVLNVQNLYLETINRSRLDFDYEKNCSISLSNVNVYACLICGKFLQGRGKSSYAFSHSINDDHHVYINLSTLKVYILPENYEVVDRSLDDIKYAVEPTYDAATIKRLYESKDLAHDLNGNAYRPGFVGLNNINNKADYAVVVLQALGHVKLLRDSMLALSPDLNEELIQSLALLIKKMWSSRLFRSHISPHALLQLIFKRSNKKFSSTEKSDPKNFLIWLLNNLHTSFSTGNKKTVVSTIFQGKLSLKDDKSTRFWILSLDLPYHSLFKDGIGLEDIPQVNLNTLLSAKYDKKIIALPQTLILHFNRFQNQTLTISSVSGSTRNPTVVKFPLEMDMSPYLKSSDGPVMYRLVSNIVHELVPLASLENNDSDTNNWKIQLRDEVRNEWLLLHDLQVESTEKELLFMQESYIQFWERM